MPVPLGLKKSLEIPSGFQPFEHPQETKINTLDALDEEDPELYFGIDNLTKLSTSEMKYITKEILFLLTLFKTKGLIIDETRVKLTTHLLDSYSKKSVSPLLIGYSIYRFPFHNHEYEILGMDLFQSLSAKQTQDMNDFVLICNEYAKTLR